MGITVLEPTKGRPILPRSELDERQKYGQIRPLPTGESLTTREIEDRFLRGIGRASLMYIHNPSGYAGAMTAFELGFALAERERRWLPMYALAPLNYS